MCPIEYSGNLSIEKVKSCYNYEVERDTTIIVQRHVKGKAKLYICLHSLLFYELHKGTNGLDTLLVIPETYVVNVPMDIFIEKRLRGTLNDGGIASI